MNYSGKTSFEFEIEREDKYYLLQVEGGAYFASGNSYGPPERCYTDEGSVEITSVTGPDQTDWEDKLTDDERERILTLIDEKVQDQAGDGNEEEDDPPSFRDLNYD